ncbi:hypothetical protein V5O48_013810, partial [Marasmius crinis-equi]
VIFQLVIDPALHGQVPIDPTAFTTQLAGLAPTMIIARVAYNKSVESVDQMVSTLDFAAADPVGPQRAVRTTLDFGSSDRGGGNGVKEVKIETMSSEKAD